MKGTLRVRLSRFFGTLYWKLSLTFLALLAVLAVAYIYVTANTAEMYFQETNQRLNAMVAQYIAENVHPIVAGKIDREVLRRLFDNAMVINPSVEVYLLDPKGYILAYSAPDSVIKRKSVSLEPIAAFLQQEARRLSRETIRECQWSESVLGGPDRARRNPRRISLRHPRRHRIRFGLPVAFRQLFPAARNRTMILTLVAAAVIGLVVFRLITRSLRTTIRTVKQFRDGDLAARIPASASLEVRELATALTKWQIRSSDISRKSRRWIASAVIWLQMCRTISALRSFRSTAMSKRS